MRETLDQLSLEKRLAETRSIPPGIPALREFIENLRKDLPPLLSVQEYCRVRNCCPAKAYLDFKAHRGLALKDGRSTKVVRDVALQLIAELPPWVPEKERAPQDRPYERSMGLIKGGTNLSDPAKPIPAACAPAAQPECDADAKSTPAPDRPRSRGRPRKASRSKVVSR
jgi:hypothetical protein